MQEVWRCPSAQALAGLKECLDFGASTWIALFARLGGAELLLQVMPAQLVHTCSSSRECRGPGAGCQDGRSDILE